MKTLLHGEKGFNILFIRSELDDYVLQANEFRVYAHLARRAGADGAYPAVESMAKKCRLTEETVRLCLRRLLELNLVRAKPQRGYPTNYTLTSLSEWKSAPLENPPPGRSATTADVKPVRSQKTRHESGATDGRTLVHGEKGFNILFIRSELDDYILTANEFRVYAHLARRAGSGWGWPSVDSMARKCRLHGKTVRSCLRRLKELNLVTCRERLGKESFYRLTPLSEWKPAPVPPNPSQEKGAPSDWEGSSSSPNPSQTEGDPSDWEATPPKAGESSPPKGRETKGIPEGNPPKDNTVAGPSTVPGNPQSTAPAATTPPALPPNGSVTASHHAALSGNPSQHRQQRSKPRQTPLQRKAYAIATRLMGFHWDNCKVRFSLHPARAYAERALHDGHDEGHIQASYSQALHYCHGVATDEINRGERNQQQKATCALTVTLAAEGLGKDGKTPSERWAGVVQRLHEECRLHQIEEAQIAEQVAQASPLIAAWFARNGHNGRNKSEGAA